MLRAFFDGLAFRVAALLALALFPIGLIALSLTHQVSEEVDRSFESSLLALTAQAAAGEEAMIRQGLGALSALSVALDGIDTRADDCSQIFTDFALSNPQFTFAGYINADGIVACGSKGVGTDLSQGVSYPAMKAEPDRRIDVSLEAPISGTSVILLSEPVYAIDGGFNGLITLSLPHKRIFQTLENLSIDAPVDLVTFNDKGQVISSEGGLDSVDDALPIGRNLIDFVGKPRTAFSGVTVDGRSRVFAVVPIVADRLYALGSWRPDEGVLDNPLPDVSPLLFPIVMWFVSLAVAYFAVDRLVIKHIRALRLEMVDFMRHRKIINSTMGTRMLARELRDIDNTWHELAETVVRDEAELEGTIHDKTVLLKEVHHRVKNNLQLIASIVNMKIRKARSPEAKVALREVQTRVMSIATVHRALYETSTEGRVRADELLKTIVDKSIEATLPKGVDVDFSFKYDQVVLYPDQAVPLSLLAAEAVTNALKYFGSEADENPCLEVHLEKVDEGNATFSVHNSKGIPVTPVELARGTGLGAALISGFASQMRGSSEVFDEEDEYRVHITFPIFDFDSGPASDVINRASAGG
ncbi:putative sensor histidine kinase pdtaS [Aquimixticola soesokkakensis]|uniref:histidine kinase n=1 Tax=Aquimixticola soesokkakensis TaxID=1519096 RepID=A0A1Y5RCN2_9RHOB|nr:sensor histidine kinase [Aquimixticola soesokkakensis]SLN14307.1 putative sensor histidine kinase pdtaS [Aquimixticola soesokkakensis]